MTTEKLKSFFEDNDFRVHLFQEYGVPFAELDTHTDGGVNMIAYLNPFTIGEFAGYVEDFDVDEQINTHRADKLYREHFSIRRSLEDFEAYRDRLKTVLYKLKTYTK